MRFGRLGTALLALVVMTACAAAPGNSDEVKADAEERGFSALEPSKAPNGTWVVDIFFGGIHCEGTLSYDAKGGVVLESEGVRVEDPDVDELFDDSRFAGCFTKD